MPFPAAWWSAPCRTTRRTTASPASPSITTRVSFSPPIQFPLTMPGIAVGIDLAINPKKNVFLTSSFTGWNNYMMDLGKLIKDAEAMKHFGNTMVLWNFKRMQPEKIFSVPGAPLEIRWSLKEDDDWAITFSALTSKLWLINHDANNEWHAKEVATIGDPAKIPLPVDASISADAKTLLGNTL